MMVIVTEAIPPMLRGRLALWLVEARAGVYVGKYSKKTRETLWDECELYHDEGNVVMIWQTPTESGFSFRTLGENRRVPSDHDGVQFVRFLPLLTEENAQQALPLLEDQPVLDSYDDDVEELYSDSSFFDTYTKLPEYDSTAYENDEALLYDHPDQHHIYGGDWDDE